MWLLPSKTKVQIELIKGVSLTDMIVGGVCAVIVLLAALSTLPFHWYLAGGLLFISILLLVRIDSEPNYIFLLHLILHFAYPKHYKKLQEAKKLSEMVEEERVEALQKAADAEADANANVMETEETSEATEEIDVEEKSDAEDSNVEAIAEKLEEATAEIIEEIPSETSETDDKGKKAKKSKKSKKDKKNQKEKNRKENLPATKGKKGSKNEGRANDDIQNIMAFTGISEGFIEFGGEYFGAAIEIPPVEFRFFSRYRRDAAIINGVGKSIRGINPDYAMNIVKIDRPVVYDEYVKREEDMLNQLRSSYEQGAMDEEEYKIRIEILSDRIKELDTLNGDDKVYIPFYYLVFFDKNKMQLNSQVEEAVRSMRQNDMNPKRLNDKELAVFLRYNYDVDFDEREIEDIVPSDYALWAMPRELEVKGRTVEINHIVTNNMRVIKLPTSVEDNWLASVMSFPSTRVMVKCKPMDRAKAIRKIDWSLQELRGQYNASSTDSKLIELESNIESLSQLLVTLQNDNETLLNCNIYVTTFDIEATNRLKEEDKQIFSERMIVPSMKKTVRRAYQENEIRLNNMDFEQMTAFIGAQVSAFDPLDKDAQGIPSNSIAASFPWVFANVADVGGMKLGSNEGVPVFIDFFRRDSERINSNMVIIGKSGSGKSFATKTLLTNLATEDAKIFILDPENEYTELAHNLHGKFINVGNAQYGRLNPFHIITALDDDEAAESVSGSYATHLQFLEEFFRQILPDCEKESLEYLNNLIDRMYFNFDITAETNLALLDAEDYPVFDDLYDIILEEFQQTDNEYIRTMLRTLMNYIAKFSSGGRNANIWNGPSTISTEENFTVFNFQSLLSNRNQTVANAQMLLVLKYVDNEIIKNREYNEKYNAHRKIVVVIDEAHVFIDEKYPIALDFMYQLAKRIRKYNGMQIVITQNIKDFVGSEELAKKSTAIINACQYSMIFSLAPNDMDDLCKLYEKAGGINEIEQEEIVSAPRGQAFAVMGPQSRTTFQVEAPPSVVDLFQNQEYISHYFLGEEGDTVWEEYVGDSREKHEASTAWKTTEKEEVQEESHVTFSIITDEEEEETVDSVAEEVATEDTNLLEEEEDWDIPDDAALEAMMQKKAQEKAKKDAEADDADIPKSLLTPNQMRGDVATVQPDMVAQIATQVAAAVAMQIPQTAPQVTPQVTVDMSETNQLLASFLEKFSTEMIQMQVQQSVKAAMAELQLQNLVAAPQTPVQVTPVASVPVESTVPEEEPVAATTETATEATNEDVDDFDLFADFGFAGDTTESTTTTTAAQDDTDDDDDFDIMSLLEEEAERLDSQSAIDQMIYEGQEVLEIRLEDLIKYTKNRAAG